MSEGAAAIEYIPATSWHHQSTLTTLFNFIYLFTIATQTNCSVIAIVVAVAIVVVTVDVIVVVIIAVVAIVDITTTAQSIHHLRWAAPKKLSWSSQTLCEAMAANMEAWSMNRYI